MLQGLRKSVEKFLIFLAYDRISLLFVVVVLGIVSLALNLIFYLLK